MLLLRDRDALIEGEKKRLIYHSTNSTKIVLAICCYPKLKDNKQNKTKRFRLMNKHEFLRLPLAIDVTLFNNPHSAFFFFFF